jgi:hypothetical protein
MKFLPFIILMLVATIAAGAPNEEITPLQLGQATLETIKSLTRKEKITADKIQIISVNPEFTDASSNEQLLEIKMSFVSTAGPLKEARFLCHAVDHAVIESAQPHCHREQ